MADQSVEIQAAEARARARARARVRAELEAQTDRVKNIDSGWDAMNYALDSPMAQQAAGRMEGAARGFFPALKEGAKETVLGLPAGLWDQISTIAGTLDPGFQTQFGDGDPTWPVFLRENLREDGGLFSRQGSLGLMSGGNLLRSLGDAYNFQTTKGLETEEEKNAQKRRNFYNLLSLTPMGRGARGVKTFTDVLKKSIPQYTKTFASSELADQHSQLVGDLPDTPIIEDAGEATGKYVAGTAMLPAYAYGGMKARRGIGQVRQSLRRIGDTASARSDWSKLYARALGRRRDESAVRGIDEKVTVVVDGKDGIQSISLSEAIKKNLPELREINLDASKIPSGDKGGAFALVASKLKEVRDTAGATASTLFKKTPEQTGVTYMQLLRPLRAKIGQNKLLLVRVYRKEFFMMST